MGCGFNPWAEGRHSRHSYAACDSPAISHVKLSRRQRSSNWPAFGGPGPSSPARSCANGLSIDRPGKHTSGNPFAMRECEVRSGSSEGSSKQGCQSSAWQQTRTCPGTGDDGSRCSAFSVERVSSGAASAGGRIAVTEARWMRSSRRSWPAVTQLPAGTWTGSCPGRRTRPGESFIFWDPASWRGGETRRPTRPGLESCRDPRSRSERSEGACVSSRNPGILQPPSNSSTTPRKIVAMIGRRCGRCSCRC